MHEVGKHTGWLRILDGEVVGRFVGTIDAGVSIGLLVVGAEVGGCDGLVLRYEDGTLVGKLEETCAVGNRVG